MFSLVSTDHFPSPVSICKTQLAIQKGAVGWAFANGKSISKWYLYQFFAQKKELKKRINQSPSRQSHIAFF